MHNARLLFGGLAIAVVASFAASGPANAYEPHVDGILGDGVTFGFSSGGGYPITGECHWRGSASDGGTDAVLYGYATTAGPAAGTTIHCWLRNGSSTAHIANTDTTAGAPGAAASTAREILVPPAPTVTKVCAEARTLYVDSTPPGYYKTAGC